MSDISYEEEIYLEFTYSKDMYHSVFTENV